MKRPSIQKLIYLSLVTAACVFVTQFGALCVKADSLEWTLPAPQNVPAGDKTAAVIYRSVHEIVYAACPLYVRSGPGPQYDFIGVLSKGEVLRRGAIGNNGWSQVLYQDREAYVSTNHLSVSPILPDLQNNDSDTVYTDTNDTVRAICVTKLRAGPGSEYAVIGHLTKGSGAPRMAAGSNGWSKLLFHDTIAYACTGDLTPGILTETWEENRETLYAASGIPLFTLPSHEGRIIGYLSIGDSLTSLGKNQQGWSKIQTTGQVAYTQTAYLNSDSTVKVPEIETSQAEFPTPEAPFIYQYMAPPEIMPHAFFTPVNADLSKPLPLIISLHGALEIGEAPNTLKHNFITKEFLNWEYTGLDGFDAFIVCPQLTGYGYGTTWRDPEVADKFFALIDYLKSTWNIDESKIILEGHSLGGEGVFYMAADPRACFSALVPVSAYNPYVPFENIHASIRGYTGSPYLPPPREDWDSYNFMQKVFSTYFHSENLYVKNCSHYDIPMVAFEEDLDCNGKSDLIEWMLAQ